MNLHHKHDSTSVPPIASRRPVPNSSKAYSRTGLSVYDALVVHGFAPLVWGCKPQRLIDHYNQFVSSNHVDVGVGTGYFLDHCQFPTASPRLALVDERNTCLRYTSRRLKRYNPITWQRDVTKPMAFSTMGFDSLCLGGILHCLDGDMTTKGHVFDRVLPLLNPGARVFGYSIVQDNVLEKRRRRWLSTLLNRLHVISNELDTSAALSSQLTRRFDHCKIEIQGSFALFSAIYRPVSTD